MEAFQRAIFRLLLVLLVVAVVPLALIGVLLTVAMEFIAEPRTPAIRRFRLSKFRRHGLLSRGKRLMGRAAVSHP
jgi:hypothetical protein